MTDTANAALFALETLSLPPSPVVVVMGDAPASLYTKPFPEALFLTDFAGCAAAWEKCGHTAYTGDKRADIVIVHLPQQNQAADYALARALGLAAPDGLVLAVADNQAGGKTLTKRLAAFGVKTADISKHKCRVAWTTTPQTADKTLVQKALDSGAPQQRASDGLMTQAGVFSWDKTDKGTAVLLTYLPETLTGNGADFGCGIGEIGRHILARNPQIQSLACIDHDARAIECCKQNLRDAGEKLSCLWRDIPSMPPLKGLDFIVMNPPFHTGKTEDKDLGKAFIQKAADSLKPHGGAVYMVANAHLPYETLLRSLFGTVVLLGQDAGFKVFQAVR